MILQECELRLHWRGPLMCIQPTTLKSRPSCSPSPIADLRLAASKMTGPKRRGFDPIPDHRCTDAEISFTDTLMSAFAMFSLKSPSLLAFDKQRAEGNVGTIYGIERVPCDTQMREILDPVSPESLRPVLKSVF